MGRDAVMYQEMKEDNRKVSRWLIYYNERKEEYENEREKILHSSPPRIKDDASAIRGTKMVDSTAEKGDKLAELAYTEKWLRLVEDVAECLPWKMQIVLRLRQKYQFGSASRPGVNWRIALDLSIEVEEKTGREYEVGEDQVKQFWYRIVEYAARKAAKRGLLREKKK